MDTIFDGVGHGELGPMGALKALPSYKTVEKTSALKVVSGPENKSTDGMAVHRVVVLFMSLHVLAKLNTAVRLVVDVLPGYDGTWAEGAGDSVLVGKGIEPENAHEDHSDNYLGGGNERIYVVCAASAFLDGADASFNFGNVSTHRSILGTCSPSLAIFSVAWRLAAM
jgi:hypothetical protein